MSAKRKDGWCKSCGRGVKVASIICEERRKPIRPQRTAFDKA